MACVAAPLFATGGEKSAGRPCPVAGIVIFAEGRSVASGKEKEMLLRTALIQTDIRWGDKQANLEAAERRLRALEQTDLAVLPEMFATGFMTEDDAAAEPMEGATVGWMRRMARETGMAVAGSVIVREEGAGRARNRFVLAEADGSLAWYDKRHLFSFGGEDRRYEAGTQRTVMVCRGVRLLPLICYDLRFPVWSRNRNDYDALLYVASWPASRIAAWDALLPARAIENQAYVLGVNRVGNDPTAAYNGHTAAFDFLGRPMGTLPDGEEGIVRAMIDTEALAAFRDRFRAWADADDFALRI